jgi:hypothetical protein
MFFSYDDGRVESNRIEQNRTDLELKFIAPNRVGVTSLFLVVDTQMRIEPNR